MINNKYIGLSIAGLPKEKRNWNGFRNLFTPPLDARKLKPIIKIQMPCCQGAFVMNKVSEYPAEDIKGYCHNCWLIKYEE